MGVFSTNLSASLQAKGKLLAPEIRRMKLEFYYVCKLIASFVSALRQLIRNNKLQDNYDKTKKQYFPIVDTIGDFLKELKLNFSGIKESSLNPFF